MVWVTCRDDSSRLFFCFYLFFKENIFSFVLIVRFKIIRYRCYDKRKELSNWYREQILLFVPFTNEKDEIEAVNDLEDKFRNNADIIAKNRRKFDNLIPNQTIQEAIEDMEKELEEIDDRANVSEVAKRDFVDKFFMDNARTFENDDNNLDKRNEFHHEAETFEKAWGYHVFEQDPKIRFAAIESNAKNAKARKRLSDDNYNKQMCKLNRKQFAFLINCLNEIKTDQDPFHYFCTGMLVFGVFLVIYFLQPFLFDV